MRRPLFLLSTVLLALTVASCGTTRPPDPVVVTRDVQVPVPVPCAADPGPAPAFPDTDAALAAAPDVFAGVQLLLAGRALRMAWVDQVMAANAGCRGPPAAAP